MNVLITGGTGRCYGIIVNMSDQTGKQELIDEILNGLKEFEKKFTEEEKQIYLCTKGEEGWEFLKRLMKTTDPLERKNICKEYTN